jgi:hypothetical protein
MNINRPIGFAPQTPIRFGQFKVQLVEGLTSEEKDILKSLLSRRIVAQKGPDKPISEQAAKLKKVVVEAAQKRYSNLQMLQALHEFCLKNNMNPLELSDLLPEIGLLPHKRPTEAERANMNPKERCEEALQNLEDWLRICFPKQEPTLRFERFTDEWIRVAAVDKDGQDLNSFTLPGKVYSVRNNGKVLTYDKPETMQDELRSELTNFANRVAENLEGSFKEPVKVPFLFRFTPQPDFDPSKNKR